MGGICSSDSLPDVPKVIRPDPEVNAGALRFAIRKMGMFIGRDYSVYEGVVPDSSTDKVEKMWLWLNKVKHIL